MEMNEIVVFLTEDYSKNESFMVSKGLTKEEITKIVNEKYEVWWYYDIW